MQEKFEKYKNFGRDELLEKLVTYMNKNSKLNDKVKCLLENNHALA